MRRQWLFLILASAGGLCAGIGLALLAQSFGWIGGSAPRPGQDTGSSPKEAIESWAKAFTAKEPADVLRFYDESEDLLLILSSGHQINGYAAVSEQYHKGFREVAFFESQVTELSAEQQQDVAWVTCRHRAKFRVLADNTKFQLEVRTTFVLKRHKDTWRIVLEHSSPIAEVPRMKPLP
jgi:ketosteroid isomerase-like protein